MRERWGVLSVRDHMTAAPLVTEILLYDRVVVPVPPEASPPERFWDKFDPQLQAKCLEIVGRKTAKTDGLALTVSWDDEKRDRFKSKMSTAAAMMSQQRAPDQGYYMDPFHMTRMLVKDEFKPELPEGVSHAWAVAAYSSAAAYQESVQKNENEYRKLALAAQIAHRFLTPSQPDPNQELLRRAVDLSHTDAFRRKRQELYAWQESVLEDGLTDEAAVKELEGRLSQYNDAVKAAFGQTSYRFGYTIIPIVMGMGGAFASGSLPAIVLAGAGGLVSLARFAQFDRKPKIEAGDLDGAAMVHDAQKLLFSR